MAEAANGDVPWTSNVDNYGLKWLFDPDRNDHLPIEEQLGYYQQRNLDKAKLYKVACSIFGGPKNRKRVIIAGNMESTDPVSSGQRSENLSLYKPVTNPFGMDKELKEAQEKNNRILGDYKNWVDQRKQFRKNLDSMGLNETWLRRKPDKTPQEQRILTRMIHDRTKRSPTPPPAEPEPKQAILPAKSPAIRRPSPLALQIIERFLYRRKLRLIDLFKTVDKNKTWRISQDEFRIAIKQAGIPLPHSMLEDLILTLDIDLDNKLDYREFAVGLGSWKVEKRDTKHQKVHSAELSRSPEKLAQVLGFELAEVEEDDVISLSKRFVENIKQCNEIPEAVSPSETSSPDNKQSCDQSKTRSGRSKSASSTGSSNLEVPPPDLRPEKMVLPSAEQAVDQRIRARATLKRTSVKKQRKQLTGSDRMTTISTGDPVADRHLMPSTMVGDPAPLVNKFRQLKYSEYNEVCNICRIDKDVRLNENTLKKVLLYPEDRNPSQIKKHIRHPEMPLLSKSEVLRSPTYHKDFTRTRSIPGRKI